MNRIYQQFDLSLVNNIYTDGVISLQFEIAELKNGKMGSIKFFLIKTYLYMTKLGHIILAVSNPVYLALNSKRLPNCGRFSTISCCENILVTNRKKHTCESAIYWSETAKLIIGKT